MPAGARLSGSAANVPAVTPRRRPGPRSLWLVRHAESRGNVADAAAADAGATRLDLDVRDPDVDLSDTGEQQARALGRHLASLPEGDRPTVVVASPYRRASRTARLALEGAGWDLKVHVDERLRERDLGAFDGMTGAGIREEFPDEAERRNRLGKFYYRGPSAESWADVALRVRTLIDTWDLRHDGEDVLVVSHQAVLLVLRYVLEDLTEEQVLEVDAHDRLANASLSVYRSDDEGSLQLACWNGVDHLEKQHEDVTAEPDPATGDRGE